MTTIAIAAPTSTSPEAPYTPARSAQRSRPWLACSPVRTRKVERMAAKMPMPATSSGSITASPLKE